MDLGVKKNISLGFEAENDDGIPNREEQELAAEDSEPGDTGELGESGENYMDRSQDSMPDFSHLQQQRDVKRMQTNVEKPNALASLPVEHA